MKKAILIILAIMAIGVVGCKKDEAKPTEIKIPLTVSAYYSINTAEALGKSKFGTLTYIPNITITLYKTKADLAAEKNKVASGVTNADGEVKFNNLETGEYYIAAEGEGCLSNIIGMVEGKNKVVYKKNEHTFFLVRLDKLLLIQINNHYNKNVYAKVDYEEEASLIPKDGSLKTFAIPTTLSSTPATYLNHKIELYNNKSETTPFKEINVRLKDDCTPFVLDLNSNKRNLIFVFKDQEQNLLERNEVKVEFNGETKWTNAIGEVSFEISDETNISSCSMSTYCEDKTVIINPSSYSLVNNYEYITIKSSKGKIKLKNNSSNPYTVTIEGNQYVLNGGEVKLVKALIGNTRIDVKQNSGYVFTPTERTYTKNVECGKTVEVNFP